MTLDQIAKERAEFIEWWSHGGADIDVTDEEQEPEKTWPEFVFDAYIMPKFIEIEGRVIARANAAEENKKLNES